MKITDRIVVTHVMKALHCVTDVAAGGSFDWTKAKLNMAYSYGPELRPATAAQGGFDIPASNITPSGQEIFAAVVAVARNASPKI